MPDGERWCPNCGADVLQGGALPPTPAPEAAPAVAGPQPIAEVTPGTAPVVVAAEPIAEAPASAPAVTGPIEPAAAPEPVGEAAPPPVAAPEVPRAAYVILPDNTELEVTTVNRIFGRADFGRYISADDAAYISRKHLSVFEEGGKYYVRDEGSTNGTKVNGVDIKGKGNYEVHDGDLIDVGDVVHLNFRIK